MSCEAMDNLQHVRHRPYVSLVTGDSSTTGWCTRRADKKSEYMHPDKQPKSETTRRGGPTLATDSKVDLRSVQDR